MTTTTEFASTPCYVLKSGNQPIFPTINLEDSSKTCICVYGFSDKPIYDKFIDTAPQLLTPYPLVEGYLANQIAEAEATAPNGVCLVILDATDPTQSVLSAATMAEVLRAQQEKARQVSIVLELAYDPETASYFVAGGSIPIPPSEPIQVVK